MTLGRRALPAALAVVAFGCLVLAFVVANPPWAAPDEAAQQVRAAAFARGQIGASGRSPGPPGFDNAWYRSITRTVDLPGRLVPPLPIPCFAFRIATTAACQDADPAPASGTVAASTYLGTYPPLSGLVPGLAMQFAGTPRHALYLGRLAAAAMCVALVGLGTILFLGRSPRWRIAGPALALTPMAVFITSTLSSSGLEVAGGYCTACALVAVSRPGAPRVAWIGLASGGAALVAARQLGPLYAVMLVAGAALAMGRGPALSVARRMPRWVPGIVGAVALATLWWDVVVMPAPPGGHDLGHDARLAYGDFPVVVKEMIGQFGWLDAAIPPAARLVWQVGVVLVVATALVVGTARARALLVGSVAAVTAVTWAEGAFLAHAVDSRVQGRWILPLAMAVPLLAVEIVDRSPASVRARSILSAAAAVVAGAAGYGHWRAFVANGHRYAGPALAAWRPPLGWGPWLVLAATGAVLLAAAGATAWATGADSGRYAMAVEGPAPVSSG
jgi:hypothetical protein